MRDLKKIGDQVIAAIKEYVGKAVAAMSERMDSLERQVKDFTANPPDIDRIISDAVKSAASEIPRPEDGKSVTVEDVRPLIEEAIAKAVEKIPVPADGKDADPQAIAIAITEAVNALPKPENGKDADPELIRSMVSEEVAAMPQPADGKSVTVEDVAPLIAEQVKSAVDALPKPQDGKDVDPEVVREFVAAAVEAIPKPKDGTSVTVDDVRPLITEEVAKSVSEIPAPKNGKDVDPEMVARTIAEEVAKAVDAIPRPRDGKDADPQEIAAMVERAVSAVPKPKDGESVPADQVQRMVDEAVAKAMTSVRMPKDGDPGRDAAHIEILPAIDSEKAYPRGTYAKHAGGLWRSFETTAEMKGWECIVDGIAAIEVDTVGDRGCAVVVRQASGTVQRKEFSIPMVIDRGVYRPESDYAKGDGVTWGGSFFIAQKAAPTGKPGECDDWRLAVKRGQNGKDFRPDSPVASAEPVRIK